MAKKQKLSDLEKDFLSNVCKKHKPINLKLRYVQFHDWADIKIRMGHVSKQCPDCKRYFFKCEFNDNKVWRKLTSE
jgi:hypothetical protein